MDIPMAVLEQNLSGIVGSADGVSDITAILLNIFLATSAGPEQRSVAIAGIFWIAIVALIRWLA